MTTNQLAYLNYLETNRANLARERENVRYNDLTTGETRRHNVATESITAAELDERVRHNITSENQQDAINAETQRSNVAREQENKRHNLASESKDVRTIAETERANRAAEGIKRSQNSIAQQQANTQRDQVAGNLAIEGKKQEETARHNQAGEQLQRANIMLDVGNSIINSVSNVGRNASRLGADILRRFS